MYVKDDFKRIAEVEAEVLETNISRLGIDPSIGMLRIPAVVDWDWGAAAEQVKGRSTSVVCEEELEYKWSHWL